MVANMKKINYKLVLIIGVIVVSGLALLYFIPLSPAQHTVVKNIGNITKILSIKNGSIYYLNDDVIIARNIFSEPEDFSIISKDISLASPSISQNKIAYIGKISKDSKINILDIDSNQVTTQPLYSSFFWQVDNLKLVDTKNSRSNIINNGKVEYSNLPFSNFTSYSNLILGSPLDQNPETNGYSWQIINPPNNSFKGISISDASSVPWVVGNFILYTNNSNQLVRISNSGEFKNLNIDVSNSSITNQNKDDQYFVKQKDNKIEINSINLNNGNITNIKTITINKKDIDLSVGISQTYTDGESLYLLISNKILVVKL